MLSACDDLSSGTRRKDAQCNQEAILPAARELFAEGGEIPMREGARRAGVGQATLYRNFPDRRDLAAALLAEQMERTEARTSTGSSRATSDRSAVLQDPGPGHGLAPLLPNEQPSPQAAREIARARGVPRLERAPPGTGRSLCSARRAIALATEASSGGLERVLGRWVGWVAWSATHREPGLRSTG
ncbi:MAG: TetR/AcrR family transcriptional regulator [Solirubrobacteraceae bacterium]